MTLSKTARISFVLALLLASSAWADGLPRVRPESLGFSSERLARMDEFYAEKVKKGEIAGIVTLIARHGKIAHLSALGYADVEKKREMRPDTIFRFYSMTKPISATALMMLYEEGRFRMNDPLSKYIPEFENLRVLRNPDGPLEDTVPLARAPTVEDALRHTAGFSHGVTEDALDAQFWKEDVFGVDVSLQEMMTRLARIPLRYQPGTTWLYSVGPDIQARLVEILSGMPFDEFLQKRLFAPLGMKDAAFWLPADKAARLATVHWSKDGQLVPMDEVHGHPGKEGSLNPRLAASVNSYTVDHKRKGGSFGLLGTAEDYWRFGQMMLNGGALNHARILSPFTVRFMTLDHLDGIPFKSLAAPSAYGFGLGFAVTKNPAAAGVFSSEGSFFWAGAAATYFWVDPKEDMVVVAMTQHLGVPAIDPWKLQGQMNTWVYSALLGSGKQDKGASIQ